MTFAELGGIGEFVGGIGVIVSLVYLVVQIRQNSRIERLKARQSIGESLSGALEKLESDSELRRIRHAARDADANTGPIFGVPAAVCRIVRVDG